MSTSASHTKSTPKPAKKSRIVILRLAPDNLTQYPASSPSNDPQSIKAEASPSAQAQDTADKASDSNSTPVPNSNDAADPNSLAPPKGDAKKKRGGAAIAGRKRAPPSIDPNAPMKERGRPGPKKKPRLPDGTIDRSGDKSGGGGGGNAGGNPIPAHKLGPKANTGAINAGLRALDRTGKPCRKWNKKPLQLKSFTGTAWGLASWKAPLKDAGFAGDVKSDSTGSSEVKPVHESSAVPSERSHADGGDTTMVNGIDSSPAPPIAA